MNRRKELLTAAVDLEKLHTVSIKDIPDEQLYEDRSEMFRRLNRGMVDGFNAAMEASVKEMRVQGVLEPKEHWEELK